MSPVAVIGAGGHARSLLQLLQECGYCADKIVDFNSLEVEAEKINDISVVDKNFELDLVTPVVLAIGDNHARQKIYTLQGNVLSENLISPSAAISAMSQIGCSNQIFTNTVINTNTVIGENNIINTGAIIEHECKIGSHNHISVGTVLAGRVIVGDYCFIGANSTVIENVKICSNVIVGAGSVVIHDISIPGTYAGNPVRKIK